MPEIIPLSQLAIAFTPVLLVLGLLYVWRCKFLTASYAVVRMLVQLMLIGYVLAAIFSSEQALVIVSVLLVMACIATWISLRTIAEYRKQLLYAAFLAILLGGGGVLGIIVLGVLRIEPWFMPRYVIPLAGMIFANCMNSISLAAERFVSELEQASQLPEAKRVALEAALIPTTNSLFAVGLVSIPGMMTGQVLAGVEPFVAARYQIVVMCMVYGSAGLSAAGFLSMAGRHTDLLQRGRHCQGAELQHRDSPA